MAPWFKGHARQAGEPGGGEGVAQRGAVVAGAGAVHLLVRQLADEGAAAEEAALEVTLLVGEGHHVHGQPRAGEGEGGDHAQGAVQPAGLVLALDVATDEEKGAGAGVAAEHVADTVDGGFETAFGHARHQPAARLHVLRRKSGAVYAGLVGADLAKLVQVPEEVGGVDGGHGEAPGGAVRRHAAIVGGERQGFGLERSCRPNPPPSFTGEVAVRPTEGAGIPHPLETGAWPRPLHRASYGPLPREERGGYVRS